MNARGRVTVVVNMVRGGNEIAVRTKPPGRAWTPRVVLTKGPRRQHGFHPTLSVAANGAAALTWEPMSTEGMVVLRKAPGRRWAHASFTRFEELSFASGVAARGDGAVLVVGNRTTRFETVTAALVRAYRPGYGWRPAQRIDGHGDESLAAFGPQGRAAVVWTRWASGNSVRGRLHATEIGPGFRWRAEHPVTRWFGDMYPAMVQDLVIGRNGRIGLAWSRRGQRYSHWWPGQAEVDTMVPLAGQPSTATHAASHSARGDLALAWYRQRPDPSGESVGIEEVHVSLSRAGSGTWRASPTMGTSTCGQGERGDPGCRPVAAAVLPDGAAAVVWFDLDNELLARVVG